MRLLDANFGSYEAETALLAHALETFGRDGKVAEIDATDCDIGRRASLYK
jgi:hypothetical protein